MKFTRLDIKDVILCEPQVFGDERGYFSETFRLDNLEDFLDGNILTIITPLINEYQADLLANNEI